MKKEDWLFNFDRFARSYPITIIFSSIVYSLISSKNEGYILSILLLFFDLCNHFIKEYILRPIWGNKYLPILGYGRRPKGAKNCGLYIDNTTPRSYGMPSGHSQTSALFSTFIILNILNNNDLHVLYKIVSTIFLSIFPLLVMYSRVYWAKCHTIQQVIIGASLGVIIGCLIYKYKEKIFLKKYCSL